MKTTINFQRLFSSFLLSCLFLFLSACAMVGPEYNKPDAPLQEEWTVDEEEEKIRQKTMSDVPDAWWQDAFNDQILN
ncbi:MAG: hypothetical protein U9R57_11505, partial [Thermodesulfobacteriota bacterium]|nr:hypothetical protein [Thermodesulfobacteriota bacterium]